MGVGMLGLHGPVAQQVVERVIKKELEHAVFQSRRAILVPDLTKKHNLAIKNHVQVKEVYITTWYI